MPSSAPTFRPAGQVQQQQRRASDQQYAVARRLDPDKQQLVRARSAKAYRRFRTWFRATYPLCCDPFRKHERQNITVPMEDVHHIAAVKDRLDLMNDPNNCAPLCRWCHNMIESRERQGIDTTGRVRKAMNRMRERYG